MFLGEYHPSIDDKGRVAIPMRLRKSFGGDSVINSLVVTLGFDKCLMGYRVEDWEEFTKAKLLPLHQSDPKNRIILRRLLGGANICDLDKQGRILIPVNLLEKVGIKKNITIVGLDKRIEIWSDEIYKESNPDIDIFDAFGNDLGF